MKKKSAYELRDDGLIYFNGMVSWVNGYYLYGLAKSQEQVLRILRKHEKSHVSSW